MYFQSTPSSIAWAEPNRQPSLTRIFGSLFNAVYLLPKFAQLYGMPLESIIGMGAKINPAISNISTFVLLAVAPLNLIKGTMVSILTMLLYKKVAKPLFQLHK